MPENKRIPYAVWKVGDEEYKLKLTTAAITKLEQEFKTNLLNILMNQSMPSLFVMLKIAHSAMQKFNHGIKEKEVQELFDQYLEDGGSQTEFLTDVILPTFQASGFFSVGMEEQMKDQLLEAKEQMI